MVLKSLDRLWFCQPVARVRAAAAQAADLVAPTWCVGCRAAGTVLCQSCRGDLRLLTRYPFRAEDPAEALPLLPDLSVLPVLSAAEYTTLVAEVVLAFKDHERVPLGHVLAPALGRAVTAAVRLCRSEEILLVWPPPRQRSQLRRGRHPLGELIGQIGLPPGVAPAGHFVGHRRLIRGFHNAGLGQKTRSKRARRRAEHNFRLAPGAQHRLRGAEVVLVDDVLTTGATLGSLYRQLTASGAQVRAAAVLAATPR